MVITSFGPKGYSQYGKRFIETFLEHWPESEKLICYIEEPVPDEYPAERVEFRELYAIPAVTDFLDRVQASHPIFRGMRNGGTQYDYHFDAYRFCRKVFSIVDAYYRMIDGAPEDVVLANIAWLDADTYTFKDVPENFIEKTLDGQFIAYLGREQMYSEAGYIAFDPNHPVASHFFHHYASTYTSGAFKYLGEWHDCYVLDFTRCVTGAPGHNLAAGLMVDHPFVYSMLGQFLDHAKGGRKEKGYSPEHPTLGDAAKKKRSE